MIELYENDGGEIDIEFMKQLYQRNDLTFTPEEEPIVRSFEEALFVSVSKGNAMRMDSMRKRLSDADGLLYSKGSAAGGGGGGTGDHALGGAGGSSSSSGPGGGGKGRSASSADIFFGEEQELVDIMMERNPDVGGLVLSYCLRQRTADIETIQRLLNRGTPINVNAKDFDGNTPLIFALIHKNAAELVPLLLDHKADPSIRDVRGRLPIFHETFRDGKKEKIWKRLFSMTNPDALTKEEIVELFLEKKKKVRTYEVTPFN